MTPQGHYGDQNNIRKIIRPYYNENDEILSWVLVDNIYPTNIYIIKQNNIYSIISAILREMLDNCDDMRRLYLLCDVTHNIPSILVDEVKKSKAIKIMVKEYRRMYNPNFLKDELKLLWVVRQGELSLPLFLFKLFFLFLLRTLSLLVLPVAFLLFFGFKILSYLTRILRCRRLLSEKSIMFGHKSVVFFFQF